MTTLIIFLLGIILGVAGEYLYLIASGVVR